MCFSSNWPCASKVGGQSDDGEWGGGSSSSWLDCWLDDSRPKVLHRSQHKHNSLEPPAGKGGASTGLGEGGVSWVWSVLCWPHQQTCPIQTPLRTQVSVEMFQYILRLFGAILYPKYTCDLCSHSISAFHVMTSPLLRQSPTSPAHQNATSLYWCQQTRITQPRSQTGCRCMPEPH